MTTWPASNLLYAPFSILAHRTAYNDRKNAAIVTQQRRHDHGTSERIINDPLVDASGMHDIAGHKPGSADAHDRVTVLSAQRRDCVSLRERIYHSLASGGDGALTGHSPA